MLLRSLTLCFLLNGSVAASELYSWHTFDTPVLSGKRYELRLHSRVRSRHEGQYLDQVRGGAVLRWDATPRLIPFAGIYFEPQQVRPREWTRARRFTAGLESPFQLRGGALTLTARLLVERLADSGHPDYTRYRSFARLDIGNRRVAPFLLNEWFAVRQGFHSVRNSGGLLFRLTPRLTVEGGYSYDIRRTFWGGDRQAIVTAIRWQPKAR